MKLRPYLDEQDWYAAVDGRPTSSSIERFIVDVLDSPFSCWWERQLERCDAWFDRFEPWLDRLIAEHEPPLPKTSATIISFPNRPRAAQSSKVSL
jgi:hypothetical protein